MAEKRWRTCERPERSAVQLLLNKPCRNQVGREGSLVHYSVVFAIIEHPLVPIVPFVPSILNYLNLPSLVEGRKNLHVIRVADTDQPDLAFILQLRKGLPRFKCLLQSWKWRMQDVAIQIGSS
jgi:hypothetical protein